jgi:hypothetical protein
VSSMTCCLQIFSDTVRYMYVNVHGRSFGNPALAFGYCGMHSAGKYNACKYTALPMMFPYSHVFL